MLSVSLPILLNELLLDDIVLTSLPLGGVELREDMSRLYKSTKLSDLGLQHLKDEFNEVNPV